MPRADLIWREGIVGEPAHDAFLAAVFAMAAPRRALPPLWRGIGAFERGGRCVAAAEMAALQLLIDGATHDVTGLRLAGVVADRRGEGLFRQLMERALREPHPMLLYAAEPALYERFGFAPVPQVCYVGPAPAPAAAQPARMLDSVADAALIRRLLLARQPVSGEAALVGAPGLFLDALAVDAELRLAHLPGSDALLAYEEEEDTLVLCDVAAAAVPALPAILGSLPRRYFAVRSLFPPDRLGWDGAAQPDETGLMLRGRLPLRLPTRLPPTSEF